MVQVDLKHLINRLNAYVKRALETAAGLCISRGNYEVTIEHVFLVMIDDAQRALPLILRHFEIDASALKTELLRQVEAMKVGNTGRPVFAPMLIEFFTDSWLISSVDMGLGQVRSGALVATVLANAGRYGLQDWADRLRKIPLTELKGKFADIVAESTEDTTTLAIAGAAAPKSGAAALSPDSV